MTKQEIIADESSFQRVCDAYVRRHLGPCVSILMYDVGQNLEECSKIFDFDYDEAVGWFQVPDYEEAVSDFIRRNADYNDLESVADNVSSWTEVCEEAGVSISDWEAIKESIEAAIAIADEDIANAEDADRPDEATLEALAERLSNLQSQLEEIDDFEDWVNKQDKDEDLREVLWSKVPESDYEEVSQEHNLEPNYDDVYEHWIVDSNWFANQLKKYGQIVFEFGGLTIFGRCTTGQSMSLDGWARSMVRDLPEDHWVWGES